MMMRFIFQQCMKILILPIYVLAYFGLWDPICKKTFPVFLKTASKLYNIRMHKKKEMLFKNMSDFADASGKLHLLEIGVGPGTNFQFYPPKSCITCVDYNPNFRNVLLENMAQNTHLQFKNFVVGFAEDISLVPDGSVDVVVGTLVLCSVNNAQTVLKETVYNFNEYMHNFNVSKWQQASCLREEPAWYFSERSPENTRSSGADGLTLGTMSSSSSGPEYGGRLSKGSHLDICIRLPCGPTQAAA
ncbi:hypothetical protein Chor_012352 [Crotalus horridus]